MYLDTEIIRQENPLSRKLWRFTLFPDYKRIVCIFYSEQERKTTRHGWEIINKWDLYNRRENNVDISIPPDVAEDARQVMSQIVFNFAVTTMLR